MVGLGFLMLLVAVTAVILHFRKKVFSTKWFQIFCILMTPSGFIALLSGWIVTEVGRQPYVVYGLMRTVEAASPVSVAQVTFSLISFLVVYIIIFGAATFYILSLIAKGPKPEVIRQSSIHIY
jgi:cytochrome d ubiquinol oxidase subunit I